MQAWLATEEQHVLEALLIVDDCLGDCMGIGFLDTLAVVLCIDAMLATVVTLRREMHVERVVDAVAAIDIQFHQ
jgi:hypothetical protein